jgi:hypothetical protein
MNDSTQNGSRLARVGWFIQLVGWVTGVASVFFALSNKSVDPPHVFAFWFSFAVLVGVSSCYFIARFISERWRAKAVRAYFSSYIVGATIWLALFVTFFVLDRILNR